MPPRLVLAVLAFAAIVCLADWLGWGHGPARLLVLVVAFLVCCGLSPAAWRRVFALMLAISVAIAALATVQIWFMPRSRGIFDSPNYLGAYAAMHVFLALYGIQLASNWLPRLAFGANLLAVALSQSRGAVLALGVGGLVYLGLRRPRLSLAVVGAAALGVFLLGLGRVPEARSGIWLVGLEAASQRLLLGWGEGGVNISGLTRFYSIPLEWLLNAGLLGVAAGAWVFVEGWIAARHRPALRALLAVWLVQGLVLFSVPATSITLFAVLAYLASERRALLVA